MAIYIGASALAWTQLPLDMAVFLGNGQDEQPPETEDDDDELLQERRTVINALHAPPVKTRGVPSIWAAAALVEEGCRLISLGSTAGGDDPRTLEAVEKSVGLTVVRGAQYPADRWTVEREQKERERRDRQKFVCPPPKPTAKAKTRGRKVKEWDGEEVT